jgi:hypothetical protein
MMEAKAGFPAIEGSPTLSALRLALAEHHAHHTQKMGNDPVAELMRR